MFRSRSRRAATSSSVSTPRGEAPSTTPRIARPCGVSVSTNLDRVGGCAVDAAHLRHLLDLVQDVHRVALTQEDDERVARSDRQGVANGELDELLVVARTPDKPGARRLAEGEPEAQVRGAAGESLIQVLDRLDEVRLAEDQVELLGLLDPDRDQLQLSAHGRVLLPARARFPRGVSANVPSINPSAARAALCCQGGSPDGSEK